MTLRESVVILLSLSGAIILAPTFFSSELLELEDELVVFKFNGGITGFSCEAST